MDRAEALKNLMNHAWYGRLIAKITTADLASIQAFIHKNCALSRGDFELAVNRMFIDVEKPKRFKEIMEILSAINS